MKNNSLILFCLLNFSNYSFAQDVGHHCYEVNYFSSVDGFSDLLAGQECAKALCGNPSTNITASINDKNFSDYFDVNQIDGLAEYSKLVENALDLDIKINQEKLEKFNDILKSPENLLKSFPEKIYSNLVLITLGRDVEFIPTSNGVKVNINSSKLNKGPFASNIKEVVKNIESNIEKTIYGKIFLEAENENKKKNYIDYLDKLNTEIKEAERKGLISKKILDFNVDAYKKKDPTNNSIKTSLDSLERYRNILALYTGKSFGEEICSGDVCKKYISTHGFEKLKEERKELSETLKEKKTLRNNTAAECKAAYSFTKMKEVNGKNLDKNYESAKKKMIDLVDKSFSKHTKEKFEHYLNNELKVVKDLSGAREQGKNIESQMKVFYDDLSNYQKSKDNPIAAKFEESIYSLDSSELEFSTLCSLQGVSAAWDYIDHPDNSNKLDKSVIYASMFTCTHGAHGEHILIHELGHALSYVLATKGMSGESMKKFQDSRMCLNQVYADHNDKAHPNLSRLQSDLMKTEEDFADLVAFAANKSSNYPYNCISLIPTPDGTSYDNVSLEYVSVKTHSMTMARVINEYLYSGRSLPKVCNEFIKQNASDFKVNKCRL